MPAHKNKWSCVLFLFRMSVKHQSVFIIIYPVAVAVGALQMTYEPVLSIFLCLKHV